MRSHNDDELLADLRGVVSGVLGVAPTAMVGRTFVELGGSSLDAVRTALRCRRQFDIDIEVAHLLGTDHVDAVLRRGVVARQVGGEDEAPPVASTGPAPGQLVPLAWQQRIIWYQSVLEPDSPRYHFYALVHFDRRPDPRQLEQALTRLVRRHPTLRTRIVLRDGDVWLEVPPLALPGPVDFEVVTVPTATSPSPESLVELTGAGGPFELYRGKLVRWRLAAYPDGRATLVHAEHHLAHDGQSFVALLETLKAAGRSEPDLRYYRYAQTQEPPRSTQLCRIVDECRDFDQDPFPPLPPGDAGPDCFIRVPVPRGLIDCIRRAAQRMSVTPFSAMLTAFSQALGEQFDTTRFIVGTAVRNRPVGQEDTVGMFVSTVPVPVVRAVAGEAADQTIRRTDAALARAIERSDVPVTEIVSALGRQGMHDRDRFIRATFSMHHQLDDVVDIGDHRGRLELGVFNGAAKFPVNAIVLATGTGDRTTMKLTLEGDGRLVTEDHLWALWSGLVKWLRRWVQGEGSQRRRPAAVPAIVRQVTEHAKLRSDLTALDDGRECLTYRELAELGSARSADWTGRTVGVLGLASTRFFATAYAALSSGAAYVPLDASQPAPRLAAMVRRAGCDLLVDLASQEAPRVSRDVRALTSGVRWLDWEGVCGDGPPLPDPQRAPSRLAYIMFTSGSTGEPKGVMVSRDGLDSAMIWTASALHLRPGMTVGQTSSVAFDASAFEVWSALYGGARIRIAPAEARGDPHLLARWLDENEVEYTFVATPIAELLMRLLRDHPASLRLLATAGDRLHPVPADLPYRVVNMYGPTEATIVATAEWVETGTEGLPPIGFLVPYAYARVVTSDGSQVEDGEEGELWIGGEGVSPGYVGDPWLTAARFIPDPHSTDGEVVYRTGDRVRRRTDGRLDFIARIDRQVKIGGIRTELGEVEAVTLRQEGVRQAFADVSREGQRDALRVFVVREEGTDATAVRNDIIGALPTHLRHATVRFVPELPLSSNGKVDWRRLADLASPARGEDTVDAVDVLIPAARRLPAHEALRLIARLVGSAVTQP